MRVIGAHVTAAEGALSPETLDFVGHTPLAGGRRRDRARVQVLLKAIS